MHVPDGFFTPVMSVGAGAVAAAAIGVCLRGSRRELDERTTPLAGLTAAFVFAVQMLNFPIPGGTSGHLLGGTLAAILVGPYTGVLCMSVVLAVQALFFADGGITALGLNVILIGIVPVLLGYGLFRAGARFLSRRGMSAPAASFAAAFVSVPASAATFASLYMIGGTTPVPLPTLFGAMVGVHTLIGIGEGAITAVTVGTVLSVRPDLVYAARDVLRSSAQRGAPSPTGGAEVTATREE